VAGRIAARLGNDPVNEAPLVELASVEPLPVLLVDDRPENLRTLEAVLSPLGYPLRTATSGTQALRLLLEQDFGLILLDVRMPGLDGLETARLIKERERSRDIPIVFLTAARDEVGNIIEGYGVGAVDYVLKPFDAELLRSKVAVFAELEASRRALKRSETFLRAAFEAAPIGKTVLDGDHTIVRSNAAFARLVERDASELQGVAIAELCHPEDRQALSDALDVIAGGDTADPDSGLPALDLRVLRGSGSVTWVALVASSIDPGELPGPLLLAQWVDLSARRRAEQTRAELLVEHAARTQAEAMAERMEKLQTLSSAIESLTLDELLPELALRLAAMFDADAEVRLTAHHAQLIAFRAPAGGDVRRLESLQDPPAGEHVQACALRIEGEDVGVLALELPAGRYFTATERALLQEVAERAALSIKRAQLHEQEHRIAVTLQRGLLPKRLPSVAGIELAAHYEAAGQGAEAGGDWYDAFPLSHGRLGVVVGDVAGRGIAAAATMAQLRSVARAFAVADDCVSQPGEVLTRLNRHQLTLASEELFTVIYAIVDPCAGTVAWANAGHPPPLVRNAHGGTSYLHSGTHLMGIEDVVYDDSRADIGHGAVLVLYSDGLIERRGESLDAGLARLARAAGSGPAELGQLCSHIIRGVLPADAQLHDDVTALLIKLA
jgi:PAS domain S-box-containing protein